MFSKQQLSLSRTVKRSHICQLTEICGWCDCAWWHDKRRNIIPSVQPQSTCPLTSCLRHLPASWRSSRLSRMLKIRKYIGGKERKQALGKAQQFWAAQPTYCCFLWTLWTALSSHSSLFEVLMEIRGNPLNTGERSLWRRSEKRKSLSEIEAEGQDWFWACDAPKWRTRPAMVPRTQISCYKKSVGGDTESFVCSYECRQCGQD